MTSQHDIEKVNRDNFRSSLEALARPGELQPLVPLFGSGFLAMASVVLYAEVTYFYEGTSDFQLIRAICGAKVAQKSVADYHFYDTPESVSLQDVHRGTPESPEFGATLIIGCRSLAEGLPVTLSGPGINGHKETKIPVTSDFIYRLQEVNDSFPMGVDIFFVSEDALLFGLPRTTTIEVTA